MANSIKFDRTDVIQKAKRVFWEKGFNGTSMRDLQDAINLRPGSIYASFGDKEQLYSEALTSYASDTLACLEDLSSSLPVKEAIHAFMQTSVIGSLATAPSQVCMLIKTISELTGSNNYLVGQAKESLSQIEERFVQLLTLAQQQGDLDPSVDPSLIAKWLQVQIIGLKTYAQSGIRAEVLDKLLFESVRSIFNRT